MKLSTNKLQKKTSFVFARFALDLNLLFIFNLVSAQLIFNKEEYAKRRARLMERIPDSIMLIRGATMPASYVQFYQYNNLMYLTGVEVPDVILLVDGIEKESYLFMSLDEEQARCEGFSVELAMDPIGVSGIDHILPPDSVSSILTRKLAKSKIVYAPHSPNELMAEFSDQEKQDILKSTYKNTVFPDDVELYNLRSDPGETINVAGKYPEIVNQIRILAEKEKSALGEYSRKGTEVRKTILIDSPKLLIKTD
jgi:hypothetical protein